MEKKPNISARKVIVASFAVDILDIVFATGVAYATGSVVMLTEALEGISDLTSSGLLWIGLKRSQRRDDRTHPFGYGREIYFWTLLAALIMFGVTSTVSIYFGWQRFLHPKVIENIVLAQIVLLIAFFSNGYAFYLSYKRLIKKRRLKHVVRIFYRSSLIETKTTFILDLMGTVASLLGTMALGIYVATGDIRFDGLGAILIGITLAFLAFLLLMGIRDLLVGRSASFETEEKIRRAALKIDEVKEVLDLKTLHVGSEKLLVNLEVNMESHLSTGELEQLIDRIKEQIQVEVPSVKYIQVELETPDKH
jgi:cation diffusion facilitator family transporter